MTPSPLFFTLLPPCLLPSFLPFFPPFLSFFLPFFLPQILTSGYDMSCSFLCARNNVMSKSRFLTLAELTLKAEFKLLQNLLMELARETDIICKRKILRNTGNGPSIMDSDMDWEGGSNAGSLKYHWGTIWGMSRIILWILVRWEGITSKRKNSICKDSVAGEKQGTFERREESQCGSGFKEQGGRMKHT